MARQRLSLDTVEAFDPAQHAQFRALLKRLVDDCRQRPLDKSPRKLSLELTLRPKLHDQSANAECDHVELQIVQKAKLPQYRSKAQQLLVHNDNTLSFNPDLPDDDGATLFDEDERRDDAGRNPQRNP